MPINENKIIPIFFASDDTYFPFLSVTIESIKANASKQYKYKLYVLNSGLKDQNIEILDKYNDDNFEILYIDVTEKIKNVFTNLHTRDYYSKCTYYRLFIPNMFPNYKKALYLDCDVVVRGDISELYNIDIKDNLVGAIPDEAVSIIPEFIEYVENYLGIEYKKYFNAGILSMNLEELRNFNFEQKFLNLLGSIKFNVAQDQDYLNVICKDKVHYIENIWNKQPFADYGLKTQDLKLIHYNLTAKPWHYDNILYQEEFWKYAKRSEYYSRIVEILNTYSEESKKQDALGGAILKVMAREKARQSVTYKTLLEEGMLKVDSQTTIPELVQERKVIMEKIKQLEAQGIFDVDVENDPPTKILEPKDVDYLNKKLINKIRAKIATKGGQKFFEGMLANKTVIFKGVEGLENLRDFKGGAIVTCNHFNPFDNYAVYLALEKHFKKFTLHKVIREGNYSQPGKIGFFFRHGNTLPLSQNRKTMAKCLNAIDTLLKKDQLVLVYPEQAMWWNYRKPRPFKNGAFKFAVKSNVPVIPLFITLNDSELVGVDGLPVQEYTVHIMPVIYPDQALSEKDKVEKMKQTNYDLCKNKYQEVYKTTLDI